MSTIDGSMGNLSMFDLFRMEIEGQTALLSKDLLELEHVPESEKLLESVMRASHSIKGAARMVAVDPVVQISHVMEDCFVAAQKKFLLLKNDDIDHLLKAVDMIIEISKLEEGEIVDWTLHHSSELSELISLLTGILDEKEVLPVPADDKKLSAPVPDISTPENSEDRFLRISADKMSKILGMAGELLVESREVTNFSKSLLKIKRRQDDLAGILDSLRGLFPSESIYDVNEIHKTALIRLDECRADISKHMTLLEEFDRKNSNLSNKLYGEVAGSRMRPFEDGVSGFRRMVRDLSRSLGKEVVLKIDGLDCPVDRDVLEKLKAPLNHLLRNAIDHGVETIEERAAVGKPKLSTIKVSALHVGGMLLITVSDDGRGIDIKKLSEKLLSKNLVTESILPDLSIDELLEFLFLPDFSTKDEVSEISGRGVGLDVVRDMVRDLGGSVSVTSVQGVGTEFQMRLPLSLSVISALLVEVSNEPYAFPLTKVDRILRIKSKNILEMEGRQFITIDGENIGLVSASQILGFEQIKLDNEDMTIVVVSDRLDTYGVVVDRYIDQKQLSVHSLDDRLGKIPNISSAALMENGDPLFIFDVDDLVRSINHICSGGDVGDVFSTDVQQEETTRKRILVVDDSLTVREVEKDLLQTKGYLVDLAVDGVDGWNAVRRYSYDLVITDVDMPRMDGVELVKTIKQDLHLRSLPVMIVSYKDRTEDRRRGLDAGADYYLTKGSFHDETLVKAVEDLIGEAQV